MRLPNLLLVVIFTWLEPHHLAADLCTGYLSPRDSHAFWEHDDHGETRRKRRVSREGRSFAHTERQKEQEPRARGSWVRETSRNSRTASEKERRRPDDPAPYRYPPRHKKRYSNFWSVRDANPDTVRRWGDTNFGVREEPGRLVQDAPNIHGGSRKTCAHAHCIGSVLFRLFLQLFPSSIRHPCCYTLVIVHTVMEMGWGVSNADPKNRIRT